MRLKQLLTVGVVLLLTAPPALAQWGGIPGGGFRPGGGYSAYRGGSFGITLGFGVGPSYGFGGYGPTFGAYGVPYGGFGPSFGGYGGYRGFGGYGSPSYFGVPSLYASPNYYSSPTVVVPRTYVVPSVTSAPAPAVVVQPAPAVTVPAPTTTTETGLLITDLKAEGTAKAAGLRRGDVLISVDGKRVQTFEELRTILGGGKKDVRVEFVDGSNGRIDQKDVKVEDTKLGITIEEVPLTK